MYRRGLDLTPPLFSGDRLARDQAASRAPELGSNTWQRSQMSSEESIAPDAIRLLSVSCEQQLACRLMYLCYDEK